MRKERLMGVDEGRGREEGRGGRRGEGEGHEWGYGGWIKIGGKEGGRETEGEWHGRKLICKFSSFFYINESCSRENKSAKRCSCK